MSRDHNQSADRIQAQNSRWLAVLDALPDLLFELDADGRYLDYHSPRSDLLAAPVTNFLGRTMRDVLPKAAADIGMTTLREAALHGYSHGHQIQLQLDRGPCWFEFSVSRKINGPDQPATFIMLSRDITHRKNAELKVERLTRLYATRSQCNQAIVRCQNEATLFAILCRNAVDFGGFKMAWLGQYDPQTQRVVPVAWHGEGTHYLDDICITVDPNEPSGRGPAGSAMRDDRPFWFQDFQNDPAAAPWRAQAREYGWAAAAGLPLHRRGQVVGVFMVYAGEVNAFDDDARQLLLEMVMDIDYALDRFADEIERKQVQEQLRDSEERYRKAFQTSPDAVTISRMADSVCLDVNLGFERLTGWRHDEVVGRTAAQIGVWHDQAEQQHMRDQLLQEGRCSNMEADFVRKDGSLVHGLISAERVRFNEVDCVLTITRDITEKKRSDAQIERLAHFDQLTGLPNRAQLQARFQFALSLAQRSGENMALMFLDLDHFKNVNDTLGHSVGDQLLVEVTRRLTSVLRTGDTLSRMGGDEFILLLPAIDEAGASQVALKLIEALARPCQIEHHELISTCSIGIALYPQDGEDFETLSKNADAAMYRVKNASRNNFCFFTREMQAHSARSLQLVNAMHHALARGEFMLHYQPQLSLLDGQMVGVEALLRWQHPEFGMMSPAEFIPIAESSGQILAIGEWVLRTAVSQLKSWLDAGVRPMVMAVNLSAVQFRHPDLLKLVTRILQEVGLPAHHLELELTEASTMDDPVAAVALMNQLHERGVRMAMDDFGTGYSNLSHLKKFSVYKLKIDQSFVRDIEHDPDDKAIVTTIINLASSLGLKTIAEGVETAEQLAFLRQQGCDEIQGYYFSRPLPADQLAALMRQSPSLS